MNTLEFIADRYKLDLAQPSPIVIHASRWHDMGHLFNDLGFKKGVEVGVHRCKFTKQLAVRAPNTEIIAIDAWTVYPGYKEYEETTLEGEYYLEGEVQRDAIQRAAPFANVKVVKAWSPEYSKEFEDESLDFVFIDANHWYEYVVADIAAWSKKVRTGGLVIGHDYGTDRPHLIGVTEAVNGWCKSYNIKPLFTWTDKCPSWMYVK